MTRLPSLRPKRLGLTGGIGSGKSTVAAVLQSLGVQVLDADAISRATTQAQGAAMPAIAQTFGQGFVASDGSLNRVLMREHVFSHPDARALLEGIVHPLVASEIARQVDACEAPALVFDVPLLVESSRWRRQLDAVWVIDCTEETQISRVQQRNGWDRAAIEAVLASQTTRSLRLAAADASVYNENISLPELQALVRRLAVEFGL